MSCDATAARSSCSDAWPIRRAAPSSSGCAARASRRSGALTARGRRLAAGGLEASGRAEAGRAGARPPRRPADALQRAARRLGAADRLDQPDDRLLAEPVRPTSKICSKGWTNDRYCDPNALRRRRTGDRFSAGEDLARAHAAASDPGMADEERFQAGRGPPLQSSRGLGRCRLRGPGGRAEQDAVLQLGGLWSGERRHLDPHARRARGPTCAWSRRASGRISSRPTRAPRAAGRSSLPSWSRYWRGWRDAA